MARTAQDFIDSVKSDQKFHKMVEHHFQRDLFRTLEKDGFHFTVDELRDLLHKDAGVKKLSDADVATLTQQPPADVPTGDLLGLLLYATEKHLAQPTVLAKGDPGSLRCSPFVAGDPGPAAMAKTRGKKAPWRASW